MTEEATPYTERAQELFDRVRGWSKRWHVLSDGDDYPQWAGWLFSSLSLASLDDQVEYVYLNEKKLDGPAHSLAQVIVLTTNRVLSIDIDTDGINQRTDFPIIVRPRSAIRTIEVTAGQTWFAGRSFSGRPNGHPAKATLHFDDASIDLEFVAGTVFSRRESEDALERLLGSLV